MSPSTLFFFKIILAILGPLHFQINFRRNLLSAEEELGLGKDCVESVDGFGESLSNTMKCRSL